MNQNAVDRMRQERFARFMDELAGKNISPESPEGMKEIMAARERIDDDIWRSAKQHSLSKLRQMKIAGVEDMGEEQQYMSEFPDERFVALNDEVDAFSDLQADQFLKGMKPIGYEDWTKQKRGPVTAAVENIVGHATVGFEGMFGIMAGGAYLAATSGLGGGQSGAIAMQAMRDNPALRMQGAREAVKSGQRMGREIVTAGTAQQAGMPQAGMAAYLQQVAGTPEEPVMRREILGDPTAFGSKGLGNVIGAESSNIGSALGTLPFSLPAMVAPNPATQAVATLPFAVSGYGDAMMARWEIHEQQVALAQQMGLEPPPQPTNLELEMIGLTGAVFEYGSEYVGDTVQSGAIRMMGGKKVGGRWKFNASRLGNAMRELNESLMRSRGLLGQAKRLGFGVTAGVVTEGPLEEGLIPNIGVQVQDAIAAGFQPDESFWTVDRKFFDFSEEGKFGFLSEDVWTDTKVGSYAGGMTSAGFYAAQRVGDWRKNRQVAKEIEQGGTAFLTQAMVRDQETEARKRTEADVVQTKGKESGPKSRQLTESGQWRRGATTTRGSAMAMHHIEEMASQDGRREIMLVDPAETDLTLTPEVKTRMRELGIGTKPIGTIDGRRVYAPVGSAQQVLARIKRGEIGTLVGNPMVNEGSVLAGMVVFRDGAGRVVDTLPYSDPQQMEQNSAALQDHAQRRGLKMEIVNDQSAVSFGHVEDSVRRQLDADAVDVGRPQTEQRPIAARDQKRGLKSLRLSIVNSALGSKREGPNRRPRSSDPFTSNFLTPQEIGDATNADVRVSATVNTVSEDNMSAGERNMVRMSNGQVTIVEPKVVFTIKRKDGTVETIEKDASRDDGAYLPQSSPDGIYLIRENGTAFTARNAFAVAVHEFRHRTMSRSRAGAQHLARLLQIDPVYALRGGAEYMRRIMSREGVSRLDGMSDAQIIAYYRGLSQAADAVEAGSATAQQKETVQQAGGVEAARREIGTFAAESVTTTANRALGQTARAAVDYETMYRDSQDRSFGRFARWMANVLVRNGFAGPEAQQVLYEIRQKLDGVREEETRVHQKFSDRVADAVRRDLEQVEQQRRARAILAARTPAAGTAQQAATAPSTGVPIAETVQPAQPAEQAPAPEQPRQSMRGATEGGPSAMGGGGDDEIEQASALMEQARSAPPEERASLLSRAVQIASEVIPVLSRATAQIAPSSNIGRPSSRSSVTRPLPQSVRQPVGGEVSVPAPSLSPYSEDIARRQRNAMNAMAIIEGGQPAEPVDIGTVARIERARTLYQTPQEEMRSSARDRAGRRPANDVLRGVRREYMSERGIQPEAEIEDTFAAVDEQFAKRVADWFESTPVNYDDPEMLAAYEQFGRETLDQYEYLRARGIEMVPWAGEGQPYADSEDMIEDLRENNRLFYYKTLNPQEAASFGSDPEAFRAALKKNPLLRDSGIEVRDSEGEPYRQTYNDLFRAVHDILGHGPEGFQFGPRGEENAYRSHAVMFSPLARRAMATETRGQNSWVNFGPNRRNPDGTVWGQDDPRYGPWLDQLKRGEGYAEQKPILMPEELTALYQSDEGRASMSSENDADSRLRAMLVDRDVRVFSGDPRFDAATAMTDAGRDPFNIVSQENLREIADVPVVFHEANAVTAKELLRDMSRGFKVLTPINVSDTTNIPIGQSGRGVRIAIDTERVNGVRGSDTPFTVTRSIANAVQAIEVKSPAVERQLRKDPTVESMFDWANPVDGDYGVRYEAIRRSLADDAATPQQPQPAAAQTPPAPPAPPAVAAKRARAAQRRTAAALTLSQTRQPTESSISISAEPTAAPFVNPNIVLPDYAADPTFSMQNAYERINARVNDLLNSAPYLKSLNALVSAVTQGRVEKIGTPREILGSYAGRVEQSMRITIPNAGHADHALIGNLLGSLLLQEATITISPKIGKVPTSEQATIVTIGNTDGTPIPDARLRALLSQADSALGGASTAEDGSGVWAVYTPYAGNPVTRDQFVQAAQQLAQSTGLAYQGSQVRSTYTMTGATDVLGRTRSANAKVRNPRNLGGTAAQDWRLWVEAAAPIVEALRDEGFDINLDGWLQQVAGTDAPSVKQSLIAELARRDAGGRHGLGRNLIRRARVSGQGLTDGKPIPAKVTPANADAAMREVDALLARHPNALADEQSYERFLIDLFKSRDIPISPKALMEGLRNNSERMRKEMNLVQNGGRLTDRMIDDAIHGLEMAQRLRALYAAGKVQPKHTVVLMMWGMLSRGVSPYIQEGLFLDIVNFRSKDGRDIGYFVEKSMSGEWTKPDAYGETVEVNGVTVKKGTPIGPDVSTDAAWRSWIDEMFDSLKYAEGADPNAEDRNGDVVLRNGSVGSGATHNAKAFGVSFLGNIGKSVTINGITQSGLLHLHGAMGDPKVGGKQVRRVFASLGGSLGIDNKVVGFAALVAGKTDIGVYDRVRVRDHYDREGLYPNIYDGYTVGYSVYDGEDKVAEFPIVGDMLTMSEQQREAALKGVKDAAKAAAKAINADPARKGMPKVTVEKITAGGIANLFNGARGIAIYEAAERAIDPNAVFADLVKVRPDIARFANLGAEHWLNWTGSSAQEASHKTLDGLIEMIASGRDQIVGVWAKEGRYDTFHYGGEYGYADDGGNAVPRYRYEFGNKTWQFTPAQYFAFIGALSRFDWGGLGFTKVRGGPPKPKLLVSQDSQTGKDRKGPWHADPLVGQAGAAKIEELADNFGTRLSVRDNADYIDQASAKIADAVMAGADRAQLDMIFGNTEMSRTFARENLAAQTVDDAYELYKRMVKGYWPKPTQPNYTKYFDRNNALNGIVPNDIWFHGGRRMFTVPNLDISPDQFGMHVGNFNQAAEFFARHLELDYMPTIHEPVMFPLYITAQNPLEIDDMGYWQPEMILNGMRDVGVIDDSQRLDAYEQMYRDVGLPNRMIVEALRHAAIDSVHPMLDALKTDKETRHPATLPMLYWMRDMLNGMGYDAIKYPNYVEGAELSRMTLSPEQRVYYNTDAEREYRADFEARRNAFYAWRSANSGASKKEQIAAMKEIRGDQTSVVIYNEGQIKSAGKSDTGFDIKKPDIRASMRVQPHPLVLAYPHVFGEETEARLSVRNGLYGFVDREVGRYIDDYESLRRYGEVAERITGMALPDIANPYLGARILKGRLGAAQSQAQREYADILRDMSESGITVRDMDDFLTAQHALNGGNAYIAGINPAFPDGGTGMMNADAQAIIARAHASGRYGEMNRIAEDWREMLRAGLAQRLASGLITQDTYNILTTRYTHYVPLRGAPARPEDEVYEDLDLETPFGRGISTQSRGMPNRLGRESRAEGVTSQVGYLHEDTMRRVMRNDVGQRFLRLVLLVNDNGMARVITPNPTRRALVNGRVRAVYDNNWSQDEANFGLYIDQPITIDGHDFEAGDLVVIRLNNPRLIEALNSPQLPLSRALRVFQAVGNAWKFVTTGMGNPFFPFVNTIKDIQQGALNNYAARGLQDTVQTLARYPRAFLEVFRETWFRPDQMRTARRVEGTGDWARYIASGGGMVAWRGNDLEIKRTDFDQLAARVARRDPTDRSLARTLFGWYPAFFTAAENAMRLAVFQQRLAQGASVEQAVLAGRDVTVDFGKGGSRKRSLNIMYQFLNAAVQGTVNLGRAVRTAGHLAPTIFVMGLINGMINRAIGGEDEELGQAKWDNLTDYDKASNAIFMDPSGSGKHIRIPLSYGYNVFWSAGVRLADAAFGRKTFGDMVAGMVTDGLNAFNPMGGSGITAGVGSTVAAFFPTMARPLIEHPLNQNWMGRPIYPESFGKQSKADAESFFPNTPEPYITAAQALNEMTGGDAFESGIIDMSPNTMQYLVGYYTSGAGRNAEKFVKMLTNPQETEVSDIPLVRSFFGDASNNTRALSEQYNQIVQQVKPDLSRKNAFDDPDTPPEVRRAIEERGIDRTNLAIGREVEKADKTLRDVRRRMKDATPEQRERLLKVRENAMKRVIRERNRLTEP